MAYMEIKYCFECGVEGGHCNGKCNNCASEAEHKLHDAFLEKTTDEKLDYLYEMLRGMQKNQHYHAEI